MSRFKKVVLGVAPIVVGVCIGILIANKILDWLANPNRVQMVTQTVAITPTKPCYFLDSNKVTGKWEPDTGTKTLSVGSTWSVKAECPGGQTPFWNVGPVPKGKK